MKPNVVSRWALASLTLLGATALLAQPIPAPSRDAIWSEQARSLEPGKLADLILGPGHPPIRGAGIHPIGMEPPTPWITAITFATDVSASTATGFCQWYDIFAEFAPLPGNTFNGGPQPARFVGTSTELILVWKPDADAARCAAHRGFGFSARRMPISAPQLFRTLAAAQQVSRKRGRPPFPVTFNDRLADQLQLSKTERWTKGRHAFEWFELEQVVSVLGWQDGQPFTIPIPPARAGEQQIILSKSDSALVVYSKDGTIKRAFVSRYIPAPF
ncbi:MAG: hypothetical protein ABL926_10490 [Novosphingobium sp.]|uniref:hypothetical protein n=1 Tax=Novosphingobium sp. TaxID=1874826 RepID=UPI0032B848DA